MQLQNFLNTSLWAGVVKDPPCLNTQRQASVSFRVPACLLLWVLLLHKGLKLLQSTSLGDQTTNCLSEAAPLRPPEAE